MGVNVFARKSTRRRLKLVATGGSATVLAKESVSVDLATASASLDVPATVLAQRKV